MNNADPDPTPDRITIRLPREHVAALNRIAAERCAAAPPDPLDRPGRRSLLSTLVREALEAHFNLPSVDRKTSGTLESVSP
jgi:hypothetical protein